MQDKNDRLVFVLIFALALAVRLYIWPHPHEVRSVDESPYVHGSLALLEGDIPPFKYAPGNIQTWVGWGYEGLASLKYLVFQTAEERAAPALMRPYVAVNHALFDAYRDLATLRYVWASVSLAASLWAVWAGFRLGRARAGVAGAILLGGTVALMPILADLATQARPYSVGWNLGIVAIYFALASQRSRAWLWSAIVMGLAIGARIDMVLLLPLIWSELWAQRNTKKWLPALASYHGVVAITFLVTAPWFFMTLIGCLRIIATVRIGGGGPLPRGPAEALREMVLQEGLIVQVLLAGAGILFLLLRRQSRRPLLSIYLILTALSMFRGTGHGLQHQMPALILLVIAGLYALEPLERFRKQLATGLAWIALLAPAGLTLWMGWKYHRDYAPGDPVAWIEQHVPASATVYINGDRLKLPLPTAASATRLWGEVVDENDNPGWKRKFVSGMARFKMPEFDVPRALADDNMARERSMPHAFFILGSRPHVPTPRYDIKIYADSPVFSVLDLPAAFHQSGGIVLASGEPLGPEFGPPLQAWYAPSGNGTFIYASPDLKSQIATQP